MWMLVLPVVLLGGEPASQPEAQTPVIVETVRHVAAELGASQRQDDEYYVAVAGGAPRGELQRRLAEVPGVLPLPESIEDRDAGATLIDIMSIRYLAPDEAELGVDLVVDGDILFSRCWYRVTHRENRWRVDQGVPRCLIL